MQILIIFILSIVTMAGTAMSRYDMETFEKEWDSKEIIQAEKQNEQIAKGFLTDCSNAQLPARNFQETIYYYQYIAEQHQMECFKQLAQNGDKVDVETLNFMIKRLLSVKHQYTYVESDIIMVLFKTRLFFVGGDADKELLTTFVKSNLNQGAHYSMTLKASIQAGRTDLVKYLIDYRKDEVDFQNGGNLPILMAFTSHKPEKWDIMELLIPFVNSMSLLESNQWESFHQPKGVDIWNHPVFIKALAYSKCSQISLAQDCWDFASYALEHKRVMQGSDYIQRHLMFWLQDLSERYMKDKSEDE